MKIQRFTVYRQNLSKIGSHNAYQANPDDMPQFEGVIWTDGTVAIRWLTACKATSVWSSIEDMLDVHGHPEYGTVIDWHDAPPHPHWLKKVEQHNINILNSIPSDV
jgi:hypothetical protein